MANLLKSNGYNKWDIIGLVIGAASVIASFVGVGVEFKAESEREKMKLPEGK